MTSSRWPLGLLLLATLAQIGLTAWWISVDRYPNGYEVCEHLLYTRRMANELDQALSGPERLRGIGAWLAANQRVGGRSTGLHLVTAVPLALLPGRGESLISLLVGAGSLLLMVLCCYGIASHLAGPWAGALAGAFALLTPPIWGFARRYGTDLPLAAAVSLLALVLLRWPPWSGRWRPLAVGLLAGLLCLIKNAFAIWTLALILPAAWQARRDGQRLAVPLLLLAFGFAVGCAFFWWGAWSELSDYTRYHVAQGNPHGELDERYSWTWATFYLGGSWRWLGPPIAPLLLLGAAAAAFRPKRTGLLWGWLLIGFLLFTAIGTKWMRYFLPAYPALFALAAVGFARLPRALSLPASSAGLALGAWLLVTATFGAPPAWSTLDDELCSPPIQANWLEVTREIARAAGPSRPEVIGLVGPEAWFGDHYSRLELMLLRHLPLTEVHRASAARLEREARAFRDARRRVQLLVLVWDPQRPPPRPPEGYDLIGSWPLSPPDQPRAGQPPGEPLIARAYLVKTLIPEHQNR